jgi:hypothetical protein
VTAAAAVFPTFDRGACLHVAPELLRISIDTAVPCTNWTHLLETSLNVDVDFGWFRSLGSVLTSMVILVVTSTTRFRFLRLSYLQFIVRLKWTMRALVAGASGVALNFRSIAAASVE